MKELEWKWDDLGGCRGSIKVWNNMIYYGVVDSLSGYSTWVDTIGCGIVHKSNFFATIEEAQEDVHSAVERYVREMAKYVLSIADEERGA